MNNATVTIHNTNTGELYTVELIATIKRVPGLVGFAIRHEVVPAGRSQREVVLDRDGWQIIE